jgi:hypothetical protein
VTRLIDNDGNLHIMFNMIKEVFGNDKSIQEEKDGWNHCQNTVFRTIEQAAQFINPRKKSYKQNLHNFGF